MLVPATLQARLEQLHDEMLAMTDPAQAKTYHAAQLALILTEYIATATVTVRTTGTAAAQAGTGIIS